MNDGRTIWIVERNENDYIEQTILLKDCLERNERNRWKMSDDFKNERILFIERSKEKTRRGVGRSRTMNKRNNKKSNASISSGKEGGGGKGVD